MLSSKWADRRSAYDFVIVGSGYGGAITAARLATADISPKPSICILERGREWPLGSFPARFDRVAAEERSAANPDGLYESLHFRDISVIKACGLGGGSLINFNAAVIPEADVFESGAWPRTIRRNTLDPYYRKVAEVLRPAVHPAASQLPKFQALNHAARAFGATAEPLPITVNFDIDGVNRHGMTQAPCNGCGDCYTGCNYGGKNTLYMNYLPMAHAAGAEVFTGITAEWIEKLSDGGWRVHGRARDGKRESNFTLSARNVIMAAGSLNSTEILLRSEVKGLKVSPRLGSGFTGNGDFFGLAYNSDYVVQALGTGTDAANAQFAPGPVMVGIVRRNPQAPSSERFIVEEAVIPSAYVKAAQIAMASFRGEDTDTGDERAERDRVFHDLALGDAYRGGALRNTIPLMVTAMDDAKGSIVFETPWWDRDGRIRVIWDDAGRQSVFSRINSDLRRMARELGSTFIPSPFWTSFNLRRLATLHPLGGCPAGEDYMHGAVDEFGRVFAGDGSVHDGLFVADGAVLPGSIGANPFMTISAMAERIAERKIEQLRGREYPNPPVAVSIPAIQARDVVGQRDEVLDRMFQRATHTGSLDRLLNTGQFEVDIPGRRIRNDTHWKGYLPKGLPLNDLSNYLFSGYFKKFWREGERWLALTGYVEGRAPVYHTIEDLTIEKRTNDLDPGRYILLRYTGPLENSFYDVIKVVSDDVFLYRGYTGDFPNGVRGWTAPVVRSYGFEHMSALDHQRLFQMSSAPDARELEGTWRIDAVANSNQAPEVALLQFESKPDGKLEARCRLLNGIEGWVIPRVFSDHFQTEDFTPSVQELRKLDDTLMIGKYLVDLPPAIGRLLPAGMLGLLHAEPDAEGRVQLGFYYLLTRAAAGERVPGMLDSLLDSRLPAGIGVSFDEHMEGVFEGGACQADLRIEIPDLAGFLADSAHEAQCSGTLTFSRFPGAAAGTYSIDRRRSRLEYLRSTDAEGEMEMRYRLEFAAAGRRLIFDGCKYSRPADTASVAEVLEDSTTLHVRVLATGAVGAAAADGLSRIATSARTAVEREAGRGLLRFRTFENLAEAADLPDFLLSFRVTGTSDPELKAKARLAFLGLMSRFVHP